MQPAPSGQGVCVTLVKYLVPHPTRPIVLRGPLQTGFSKEVHPPRNRCSGSSKTIKLDFVEQLSPRDIVTFHRMYGNCNHWAGLPDNVTRSLHHTAMPMPRAGDEVQTGRRGPRQPRVLPRPDGYAG